MSSITEDMENLAARFNNCADGIKHDLVRSFLRRVEFDFSKEFDIKLTAVSVSIILKDRNGQELAEYEDQL